ncbi:MAG: hypothetical protein ACXWZL_11325 [Mycobacterium sp.]
MSLTSRGRAAARQTIRVQRRVALAQALFWPALVGTTLAVGAVVALRIRSSRLDTESTASDYRTPSLA